MSAIPQFIGKKDCIKDFQVYNKATFDEILCNRESLVKFLQGMGWRYYDHQSDKKGKLVSVKVEFDQD